MENFIWQKVYSVDIELFDDQHKKLFEIGERLYNSIINSTTSGVVEKTIKELRDYAAKHFSDEEYFLKKYHHDEYESHKKHHEYFISQVEKFAKEYNEKKKFIPFKIINLIQDWLVNHILKIDKQYSQLLKDKEIHSISLRS